MKKAILTTAIILVTVLSHAQAKLGIKAGAAIADISQLKSTKKTHFYGGLVLNIKTSDKYSLQPELLYIKQGATLTTDIDDNDLNGETNNIILDYLTLGIANKFYIAKNMNIHFGPSIEIRAYKNFDDNDYWDIIPPLDISFFGGLEYDITPNLSVEARYKQGIIDFIDSHDIYKENFVGHGMGDRNLNEVFQIGISYKFDFK